MFTMYTQKTDYSYLATVHLHIYTSVQNESYSHLFLPGSCPTVISNHIFIHPSIQLLSIYPHTLYNVYIIEPMFLL